MNVVQFMKIQIQILIQMEITGVIIVQIVLILVIIDNIMEQKGMQI